MRFVCSVLCLGLIATIFVSPAAAELTWGACAFQCPAGLTCSCASVTVPASWDDPSNTATMSVAVASVVQQGAPAQQQGLVVLTEGCVWENPQQSAVWTSFLAKQGSVAVFTIDPRGSGRSTPAYVCSDDPMNVNMPSSACATALSAQSPLYTLHNMALDLNATLQELTLPTSNSRPQLYLVADGLIPTAWAQKYTALCQNQIKLDISGMGLSSFTAPEQYDFFGSLLYNPDSTVRRVLALCEEDPLCAPKAGGGRPLAQLLAELLLAAEQGTLPCNVPLAAALGPNAPSDWRDFYSGFFLALLSGPGGLPFFLPTRDLLSLVPALLYRILRCSATDVAALVVMAGVVSSVNGNATPSPVAGTCSQSQPLRYNLAFSEFVPTNPLPADALIDGARRVTGLSPPATPIRAARALFDVWTKYSATPFAAGSYAPPVPVLLLSGRFDPVTRVQSAAYAALVTYNQPGGSMFYEVDQNTYGLLYSSPASTSGGSCALASMWSYFQNGNMRPCVMSGSADFDSLDFFGVKPSTTSLATTWLGTANLWNFTTPNTGAVPTNPPTTMAPPTPQPTAPPTPVPTTATVAPAITTASPAPTTAAPTATAPNTTTAMPTVAPTTTVVVVTSTETHTGLFVGLGVAGGLILLAAAVIFVVRRRQLQAKRQDYYASMYGSTNT